MKRFIKWLAVIFVIIFVFIFFVYLVIDALLDTEPYVSSNSYLEMTISGDIPEYEPHDALEDYIRGRALDFRKIRESLKMAQADERIKGIVMHIGFVRSGFGKLQELQQLIRKFQLSGKKIIAHLDYGMPRDYYLASACDSVFLSPGGNLFMTGLAGEISFYKGFLEKIGVEADFEHVGEYKNAPDTYTRQSMSDYQRKVVNAIFDARFESLVSTISTNRKIDPDSVRYFIENISIFTPEEALASKLIDGIKYREELDRQFEDNDELSAAVSASDYASIDPSSAGLKEKERMAVVYCSGTITDGEDGSDPYFGQTVGADRLIRDLKRAAESASIKAIILRIDSPGGSSLAADKIWYAVKEAAKKKPLVASISDLGASGGYYIAAAADTILAQDLSLVGSIGVFIGKFSLKGLYQKLDINNELIKRGKNAAVFSLNSKFTDSERQIIRRVINDFYRKFVSMVAERRKKTYNEIDHIARGRVWDGQQGVKIDLIDLSGGMDEAVDIAKKLAGIADDSGIHLVYYPRSRSLLGRYLSSLSIVDRLNMNPLHMLENFLSGLNMQPLALMPFRIEPE
jgi:protease-4